VVNFKAFEFPALSDILTQWPAIEDLGTASDAEPIFKQAVKYLKKVVMHYQ